jgi:hypothetical protein
MKKWAAIVGIAGSALWTSTASASTVDVGVSTSGAPGSNIATGSGIPVSYGTTFNGFLISGTATGNPPLGAPNLLDSNSLDIQSSGTGTTVQVWVTETDLTGPIGPAGFSSGLTSNFLSPGWTLTETTYFDASDTAYGTGTQLATTTFNGISSTSILGGGTISPSGLYSLTEVYTINATLDQGFSASGTINLTSAPLPAALPLFASGLVGFWGWKRRKRRSTNLNAVAA